jgi:hypothetical protein
MKLDDGTVSLYADYENLTMMHNSLKATMFV